MNNRDAELFIVKALEIGAIELIPGGRLLKSRRVSPHFFNSARFNNGRNSRILMCEYAARAFNMYQTHPFEVVFGPAYKGISIAFGVAMMLDIHYGIVVGWAHDRKETKDHGEGGDLVGASIKDQRVLLVDDVMTTGTSCDEAVAMIESAGGILAGCVLAFDRQETANDGLQSATQHFSGVHQVPVIAIATTNNLTTVLQRDPERAGILKEILAYQGAYGV